MRIVSLLRRKGSFVATVPPEATVREALDALALHNVGALVVSGDGRHVDGIVSERDVVRRLRARGGALLDDPVASIMTLEVHVGSPEDDCDELAARMTARRVRHVPVVDGGLIVGIVSIGDVVKARIDALERENDALHAYVSGR
jgi:CBS domain-containing protein